MEAKQTPQTRVFLHTIRVAYYAFAHGDFKMLPTAFLHDIGKPLVAYQKEEDIALNEYSFTDHEEKSYEVIKKWRFVSDYTKQLVRYHYLIRDMSKHKVKDPKRYEEKYKIWEMIFVRCKIEQSFGFLSITFTIV